MPTIQTDFILDGAILALRAAQAALRDAVDAHDNGGYATAMIIGAVAAEHLGRSKWLAHYGIKLSSGNVECDKFIKDFEHYVGNSRHQERLQQSLYSFSSNVPPGQQIIEALKANDQEKIGQFLKVVDKSRKRAGASYHELREQAQCIQPLKNCSGWSMPPTVSASEVHDFLMNVANSYGALVFFGPFSNQLIIDEMKKLNVYDLLINANGQRPAPEGKVR